MNIEQCRAYDKLYAETHKEERRAAVNVRSEETNNRKRNRRKIDAGYQLNCNISSAINSSLKRKNGNKNGNHWEGLVGYKAKQLKKHLEKLFTEGMTWDNYGKWHVDHRIPIAVHNFTKPEHEDFKRCWALTNLQPMWAHDNLVKGAKITNCFQPSLLI